MFPSVTLEHFYLCLYVYLNSFLHSVSLDGITISAIFIYLFFGFFLYIIIDIYYVFDILKTFMYTWITKVNNYCALINKLGETSHKISKQKKFM